MIKKICPNCKTQNTLNEIVHHCAKCGWIFIEDLNILSEAEIKEKATRHRTGKDVDRLDG